MRFIHPVIILRETLVPMLYWVMNWHASETFTFRGKKYRYFRHPHNRTWVNERIVEIALGLDILKKYKGKRILEVGNVLSQYSCVTHDILDKYDKSQKVINEDIVSFKSTKKYDIIICISTLEHVGWDEAPHVPKKIHDAIRNMKSLLAPCGFIMITTPFGYNTYLDSELLGKRLLFDETYFLERMSWRNDWHEIAKNKLSQTEYSWFVMHANTIAISYVYAP